MKRKILYIFFILLCILVLSYSIYKILIYKLEENQTHRQIEQILEIVEIEEVIDNQNTETSTTFETEVANTPNIEIIKQVEEPPKSNPYWDYINMNMINVNFNELKKINSSTVGWIKVNGTTINYPFVQASDNKYYLNHSFDKSWNSAGWVFLDYRNNVTADKNTIIYAHGRLDKTMFGSLKNILKSGWLNNPDNYIVKLSTETENTLWQVFSVYHIPTTSDYLQITFDDDTKYQDFLNMLIDRSFHNFNTTVNSSDNILTLSTCYNDSDKVVLHAKLIKREAKL